MQDNLVMVSNQSLCQSMQLFQSTSHQSCQIDDQKLDKMFFEEFLEGKGVKCLSSGFLNLDQQ